MEHQDPQLKRIVERIDRLATDRQLLDKDEPPPSTLVINKLLTTIREAAGKLKEIPDGSKVSVHYGELNVAWLFGDSHVRLTYFPGGAGLVQWGNISSEPGSYQSASATPQLLAEHLAKRA